MDSLLASLKTDRGAKQYGATGAAGSLLNSFLVLGKPSDSGAASAHEVIDDEDTLVRIRLKVAEQSRP